MHESRHFDVETAVLRDVEQPLFAPPLDRVHTIARFADSESRLCDIFEPRFNPSDFIDFNEHIERSELVRKIEDGVAHQYLIVEIDDVEADNKIGSEQLLNKLVRLVFAIDSIFTELGAVSDAYRHTHISLLIPAAYVVRCFLGFEVEIDNVHHAAVPNRT